MIIQLTIFSKLNQRAKNNDSRLKLKKWINQISNINYEWLCFVLFDDYRSQ